MDASECARGDGRCFYRALLRLLIKLGRVPAPPPDVDVLIGSNTETLSFLMRWRLDMMLLVREKRAGLRGNALLEFERYVSADSFDDDSVLTADARCAVVDGWILRMSLDDVHLPNVELGWQTCLELFAQVVAEMYLIEIKLVSGGQVFTIAKAAAANACLVISQPSEQLHFDPTSCGLYNNGIAPAAAASSFALTEGTLLIDVHSKDDSSAELQSRDRGFVPWSARSAAVVHAEVDRPNASVHVAPPLKPRQVSALSPDDDARRRAGTASPPSRVAPADAAETLASREAAESLALLYLSLIPT